MVLLVGDVTGVDGLLVFADGPDAGNRLLDRHRLLQVDELGGHDGADAVFGIAEIGVDQASGIGLGDAQDLAHDVGRQLADHVHCVVGGQVLDDGGQLLVVQAADQGLLAVAVHVGEDVGCDILFQQAEHHHLLGVGIQTADEIGGVHLVDVGELLGKLGIFSVLYELGQLFFVVLILIHGNPLTRNWIGR